MVHKFNNEIRNVFCNTKIKIITIFIIMLYAVIAYSSDNELVTVTAYTLSANETGGNKSPWIGALQSKVTVGDCAVSYDLYKKGWTKNKKIKLNDEVCTINDLMPRRKKLWIDVVKPNKHIARKFGKKRINAILLTTEKETTNDIINESNNDSNKKENQSEETKNL